MRCSAYSIGAAMVLMAACGSPIPPTASPSAVQTRHPAAWSGTGDLVAQRRGGAYTATLLADGLVLVAGGSDSGEPLASAELYNPHTGTWSLTGTMVVPRAFHTATLLSDGRVLVAGGGRELGFSSFDLLASSEVYDPASGIWSASGGMTTGRWRHTATLLADGRVLVAGGDEKPGAPSAELFDPATQTWSPTGSMTTGRRWFTATLLTDGTVLVAGGAGDDYPEPLTASEVFDPASDTWISAGNMTSGYVYPISTLLKDGRVLVVGGATRGEAQAVGEVYEPISQTWSRTRPMILGRYQPLTAVLFDGRLLVAGGYVPATTTDTAEVEVYDPIADTWTSTASMSSAREGGQAGTATLLLDGRVLVTGSLESPELYDSGVP
jgi:hypothetical protein